MNIFTPVLTSVAAQYASFVPFLLGVLGLVATIVLLLVQLISKKKVKAIKKVALASLLLVVIGIAAIFLTGAVQVRPNPGIDSGRVIKAGDEISFSTVDKDGNAVDSSIFKDSKVTLINRWEPWCNPCKQEMPDIEALYQKYKDEGFNVIGVYSSEDGLQEVLDNTGVTYPVILATEDLNRFGNSYPASVFVDSDGNILAVSAEDDSYPNGAGINKNCIIVGSRDAETWEKFICGYLGK